MKLAFTELGSGLMDFAFRLCSILFTKARHTRLQKIKIEEGIYSNTHY